MEIERAAFPRAPYTRRMFLHLHRKCPDLFVAATRARKILGYMSTCAGPKNAEIVSIAVDPEWRQLGVGTLLMEHTLARLRTRRVRSVELMVRTTSQAVRFYRRFRFTRLRTVARYYEDGAPAYHMRRGLRAPRLI